MNAKVKWAVRCLAVLATVTASTANAAGWNHAAVVTVATSTVGQLGFGGNEARKEADQLLKQARTALTAGRFEEAETLLTKAEKSGVKYDFVSARFSDTPEKVRRDLLDAKAKAKQSAAMKSPAAKTPSLLSGPPGKSEPPAATKPPISGDAAIAAMTDDAKAKAKQALESGRKALEVGNLPEAQAAYNKAILLKANYGPGEYSPDRLAADLKSVGVDVTAMPAAAPPTNPYTLRPSDYAAEDNARLPALQNRRPESPLATNSPETNPNNLPVDRNPLSASPVRNAPASNDGGEFRVSDEPGAPQRLAGVESEPASQGGAKGEAQRLLALARAAKDRGRLDDALQLAEQAQQLNVPDSSFGANETRPWQVVLEVNKELVRRNGMKQAAGVSDATPGNYPVTQGRFDPARDNTRNARVQSESPLKVAPTPLTPVGGGNADQLFREGIQALEAQDRAAALAKFQEAWRMQDQLDPALRQQLKDKLTYLQAVPAKLPPMTGEPSRIEEVDSEQQIRFQKLLREVTTERDAAEKLAATDPKQALENLSQLHTRVSEAEVDPIGRKQLLAILDRSMKELEGYINKNRGDIELRERNTAVREEIDRGREYSIEVQNKYAKIVDDFNKLLEEGRYAEAEVLAKQARELDPRNPVTENLTWKASFAKRFADQQTLERDREQNFLTAMDNVERSSIPFDDQQPIQFGRNWDELSKNRAARFQQEFGRKLSPSEQEIQKSLGRQVEVNFKEKPLADVLDTLSKMSGINIHLDPQGLHAEAVTTDTPITLELINPVSLQSALNLILTPLRLNHVIQNEVLLITSQDRRDSATYTKVYYVADLVTPIPNFVPSYNIGLPGAIRESFSAMGYGGGARGIGGGPVPFTIANGEQNGQGAQNASVLAQMGQANMQVPMKGADGSPMNIPLGGVRAAHSVGGNGPGGLGGGVIADFDTLIELITTTISPDSWIENGGKGSIEDFPTNLSLVVSQTQDIHADIADLLQQLRVLQDLQVTIEVRFINLQDDFFERIGVDFDFNVDDNTSGVQLGDDAGRSVAFGWQGDGATNFPTSDRDFQFSQNTFASAVPQFGAPDLSNAATFGFAILSDIEVFFLLNALQGDRRTNVLQAPKVTLFNGQQAFVTDSQQRPFVTQIIPVVGDFAAAHQPVVTVLSEGTSLSVQAVVSSDRRFVRLTLVPMFSKIGTVDTFTFNGRTTSNTGTTVADPTDPTKNVNNGASTTTEGSTVQLPTLAITTVSTTVSVPDGGTVLLGGVKRLSESRNERGVPLLSKVPYVNRLFKNVGIGRSTGSLMMMVTPRIIIQEEEEQRLGLSTSAP